MHFERVRRNTAYRDVNYAKSKKWNGGSKVPPPYGTFHGQNLSRLAAAKRGASGKATGVRQKGFHKVKVEVDNDSKQLS